MNEFTDFDKALSMIECVVDFDYYLQIKDLLNSFISKKDEEIATIKNDIKSIYFLLSVERDAIIQPSGEVGKMADFYENKNHEPMSDIEIACNALKMTLAETYQDSSAYFILFKFSKNLENLINNRKKAKTSVNADETSNAISHII